MIAHRCIILFAWQLFLVLGKEQLKYYHKVVAIGGDMSDRGLGLSEEDRQKLIQEVGVVFHGLANLRLNEKIRIAYNIQHPGYQGDADVGHGNEKS